MFMAFLLASISLWFLKVTDEDTEAEVAVGVVVNNVPSGIEIPEDVELKADVKAKGGDILLYILGSKSNISVDYSEFNSSGVHLTLQTIMLEGRAEEALPKDVHLKNFKQRLLVIDVMGNSQEPVAVDASDTLCRVSRGDTLAVTKNDTLPLSK